MKIEVKPIGIVKSSFEEKSVNWRELISEIVVYEEFMSALDGIEDFSHIFVIYWLHKVSKKDRKVLKVRPKGDLSKPLVGVFATRSPVRPNPTGLSVVELIERKGNVLKVKGLDAYNNTPVIDIKPYTDSDQISNIKLPKWLR